MDIKAIKKANRQQAGMFGKFHSKVIGDKRQQKLEKTFRKEMRNF